MVKRLFGLTKRQFGGWIAMMTFVCTGPFAMQMIKDPRLFPISEVLFLFLLYWIPLTFLLTPAFLYLKHRSEKNLALLPKKQKAFSYWVTIGLTLISAFFILTDFEKIIDNLIDYGFDPRLGFLLLIVFIPVLSPLIVATIYKKLTMRRSRPD